MMKRLDFHVHIENTELAVKASARYLRQMCDLYDYLGVCLLGVFRGYEINSNENNETILRVKEIMPGSFAFASPSPGEDFAKQAERFMRRGFDGIKLLRGGKPNYHRQYGYAYDHPIYADLFAFCEENGVPITMHNNDPLIHWDVKNAPQRAIEQGWVYDETYPPQSYFFEVLDRVLERYPRLNLAIAHFGFYSDDLPRAAAMLERYPNLKFDITPAILIYEQFSQTPAETEAFFRKYHDRLIFGTDADSHQVGEKKAYTNLKNRLTSAFFGGGEPVTIEGRYIHPIRLSEEMLENLYYNNAMRFVGKLRG